MAVVLAPRAKLHYMRLVDSQENNQNCHRISYFNGKMHQIRCLAWAPAHTPLEELTALPRPSS